MDLRQKLEDVLRKLSESAFALGDLPYPAGQRAAGSLGHAPATPKDLQDCEARIGCTLPEDYRTLMSLANGFLAPNAVEPSFAPLDKIDRLQRLSPDLIDAYTHEDLPGIGESLSSSILVGGFDEDQHFLLLPPSSDHNEWRYWKFANWIPGEEAHSSLLEYLSLIAQENDERVKESS